MARTRPEGRLDRLVACATDAFIAAGGFERAQIEDVARALGVAKGTVYLYVESKEALLDLCLRRADAREPAPDPPLPVKAPPRAETLAFVAARVAEAGQFPILTAALARRHVDDPAAEVEAVLGELHDTLAANRLGIRLVHACARDLPDLGALWFSVGRRRVNARLAGWLARRASAGLLRALPDAAVAARLINETLTWTAVHRHWDPAPEPLDETTVRATALALLRDALVPAPATAPRTRPRARARAHATRAT